MKVPIRRIGNSLGLIVPRAMLERWNIGEGDSLELTERGLWPSRRPGNAHVRLDELRRDLALAVIRSFEPRQIRAQILANLHRWKAQDAWVSAFDEWQRIAESGDDGRLFAAMLGRDEEAIRLRQSAPYVGLLAPEEVKKLNEEAAA